MHTSLRYITSCLSAFMVVLSIPLSQHLQAMETQKLLWDMPENQAFERPGSEISINPFQSISPQPTFCFSNSDFTGTSLLPATGFAPSVRKTSMKDGSMTGIVTDAATGETLPGANIMIVGTGMGTASNSKGEYKLSRIPDGSHTIRVTFIGYKPLEVTINITGDSRITKDLELIYAAIEGEDVVVTAQAEGQMKAINQQLSSSSIVNVVAADRIQELPDATAAESVARLPGVSVRRDGGEGTKIIIRGLSSQHNKINVEGIEVPSTDPENRSVDVSMISPYLLNGIEVQKAVTANHDANAMGGTVNFGVREAAPGLNFDIVAQGVNNGLRNTFGDYKLVGSVDYRFMQDKLGALLLIDTESRKRDSETLSSGYGLTSPQLNQTNTTYVNNVLLQDVYRDKDRLGGALVLDFKLPSTKIKLVNFMSKLKTNADIFAKDVSTGGDFVGHRSSFKNEELSFMTNSLSLEQTLFNVNLRAKAARSHSENEIDGAFWNFVKFTLGNEAKIQTSPEGVLALAQTDTVNEFLRTINLNTSFNNETIWSYQTDVDFDYSLSRQITGKFRFGGKHQYRTREFDKEQTLLNAWLESTKESRNFIIQNFDLPVPLNTRDISLNYFIDPDFRNEDYLDGDFEVGPVPNLAMLKEIVTLLNNRAFPQAVYDAQQIETLVVTSLANDYSGDERLSAGYAMTDLRIGDKIELNPGIRYERNVTEYTGIRGDVTVDPLPQRNWTAWHDTTIQRINTFWLPMIHVRVKPQKWFDIRLAYTESISRPDYRKIIPSFTIGRGNINYTNMDIKPTHSKNYDAQVSFYGNKLGLLTLGGFYKDINDQIFDTGKRVISDSATAATYSGLEEFSWDNDVVGNQISTAMNNKNKGEVWGLEFGLQTQFWYLPAPFKGLVFNANYTHIFSETQYPRTTVQSFYDLQTGTFTKTNKDTSYTSRMLDQPKDIVNMALGYDYKGFSARLSMLYQDNVFSSNNFWPELRATTDDYLRWDISIKQKLPLRNLDFTLNFVNLNARNDINLNRGTLSPTLRENYGRNIIAGLRYKF